MCHLFTLGFWPWILVVILGSGGMGLGPGPSAPVSLPWMGPALAGPYLDGSSFGPGRPGTRVRLSLNGGIPVRRRVSAASFVGPLAQRTSASVSAAIPMVWILPDATTSALACRLQFWHRNSAWLLRFFRSLYPQRGQVWDVPHGGTFTNHVPFFSECLSSFCCIAPGLAYARLRLRPVLAFTFLPGFSVLVDRYLSIRAKFDRGTGPRYLGEIVVLEPDPASARAHQWAIRMISYMWG